MPRPRKRNRSLSKDESSYRMDNPRRGVTAIFNQEEFDDPSSRRTGSQFDVQSLEKTFRRLGFEVELYQNMTLAGIERQLYELSDRDHSDCDCFVLIFMSHGLEGKLRARDNVFDINLLWDKFTAEQCPSLANKPKVFIVQACQGHDRQGCVNVYTADENLEQQSLEAAQHVKLVPSYQLPMRADFLVALSTTPGFVSWRSKDKGSWYIQALCHQLDTHGFDQDMFTLLTRVNRGVALDHTYQDPLTNTLNKQMPSFVSMLIRDLKFTRKSRVTWAPGINKEKHSSDEMEEDDGRSRSLMERLMGREGRRKRQSSEEIFSIGPKRNCAKKCKRNLRY